MINIPCISMVAANPATGQRIPLVVKMTEAGILAENPNFPYFDAIEQQRILANLSASAASYYATSKAGGAKGWTLTEAATLNEMPQGPVTFTHPQSHFVIWA